MGISKNLVPILSDTVSSLGNVRDLLTYGVQDLASNSEKVSHGIRPTNT